MYYFEIAITYHSLFLFCFNCSSLVFTFSSVSEIGLFFVPVLLRTSICYPFSGFWRQFFRLCVSFQKRE